MLLGAPEGILSGRNDAWAAPSLSVPAMMQFDPSEIQTKGCNVLLMNCSLQNIFCALLLKVTTPLLICKNYSVLLWTALGTFGSCACRNHSKDQFTPKGMNSGAHITSCIPCSQLERCSVTDGIKRPQGLLLVMQNSTAELQTSCAGEGSESPWEEEVTKEQVCVIFSQKIAWYHCIMWKLTRNFLQAYTQNK